MSPLDRSSRGLADNGPGKTLRLDKGNGKLAGVCSGLANYFAVDPLVFRLIFVTGTLIGFGSFILIYLLIWLLAD